MTDKSKPREQLFERDLAAILDCDAGSARTLPRARGRQLWLVPLILAAFGGFAALQVQTRPGPVEAPVRTAPSPPPPTTQASPAQAQHPSAIAATVEEPPVVRTSIARPPVRKRRRLVRPAPRAERAALARYQQDQTETSPFGDEGSKGKKAAYAPNVEKQSVRDEQQRTARLEAIDAVRSLRLH